MATISNDAVEALARQLLREQIERSAWFEGMTKEARAAAIAADVEQWWHLKEGEAAQILIDQAVKFAEERGSHGGIAA